MIMCHITPNLKNYCEQKIDSCIIMHGNNNSRLLKRFSPPPSSWLCTMVARVCTISKVAALYRGGVCRGAMRSSSKMC